MIIGGYSVLTETLENLRVPRYTRKSATLIFGPTSGYGGIHPQLTCNGRHIHRQEHSASTVWCSSHLLSEILPGEYLFAALRRVAVKLSSENYPRHILVFVGQ